jgi:hypothetical protein
MKFSIEVKHISLRINLGFVILLFELLHVDWSSFIPK